MNLKNVVVTALAAVCTVIVAASRKQSAERE